MDDAGPYRPVSRPYVKRFRCVYRQHLFDKLHELDLPLVEFQQLLGRGEVIAEAPAAAEIKEIVLIVDWVRPLDLVVAVDEQRGEQRLVTVYEPRPSEWTTGFRGRKRQ